MPHVNIRSLLAFAHDLAASALAWCLAYLLRFNFDIPPEFFASMLRTLAWVAPVQAAVFWGFGLYRGLWRYASVPDLKRIVLAVAFGAAATPAVLLLAGISFPVPVPRSVLVLDPLLLIMMMGGSRVAYRMWKEHSLYSVAHLQSEPVLVLGAGDAAVSLLKDLARSSEWRVVGLLDDDPAKEGRHLLETRVLGAIETLPSWAEKFGVANAIVAMPSATHHARRRAVEICREAGIRALTVPSFDDLMGGKVTVSALREVELDDLLGRDPVQLDSHGLADFLSGKTVMVTGAGGSIGSELCRQITKFKPKTLVLFELNEFGLYQIEQEFAREYPGIAIACAIGDCRNRERVAQVLGQYRPEVVFHSAAYKHVPLMEDENAWEAVQNNVLGTLVTGRAAIEHGVRKFVLISTDKAVNPVNVMGASKRLAEMACQALQGPLTPTLSPENGGEGAIIGAVLSSENGGEGAIIGAVLSSESGGEGSFEFPSPVGGEKENSEMPSPALLGGERRFEFPSPACGRRARDEGSGDEGGTRFVMVRFGNVLGSAGSVVPKFREQIARGGPVTVTHPEITRYFMSIPEAAQLVLQAGLMGQGGEIFVLDMGKPVKIVDLARDLIRLSGFGENDIRIEFTGLRPGEKLYEELLADDEQTLPTPHPKLRIAQARQVDGEWLTDLERWLGAPQPPGAAAVRGALATIIPEYRPAAAES